MRVDDSDIDGGHNDLHRHSEQHETSFDRLDSYKTCQRLLHSRTNDGKRAIIPLTVGRRSLKAATIINKAETRSLSDHSLSILSSLPRRLDPPNDGEILEET